MHKLTPAERLVIVGAALLLGASFLPWHRACFPGLTIGGFSVSGACVQANGWEVGSSPWIPLATIVAVALGLVLVLDRLTDVAIPERLGNIAWPQVFLGGGILVALFVLLKLGREASYLSYGFWIGIVGAGLVAAGGILMARSGVPDPLAPPDAVTPPDPPA